MLAWLLTVTEEAELWEEWDAGETERQEEAPVLERSRRVPLLGAPLVPERSRGVMRAALRLMKCRSLSVAEGRKECANN